MTLKRRALEKSAGTGEIAFAHSFLYPIKYRNYHLSIIKPFPNKPWFLAVCSTSILKTPWEKEKLLLTNNFSFFLSVGELSPILFKFKIVVCKHFEFRRV